MSLGLIGAATVCLILLGGGRLPSTTWTSKDWLSLILVLIFLRGAVDVLADFSLPKLSALLGLPIVFFAAICFADYLKATDIRRTRKAILLCASLVAFLLVFSLFFSVNIQNYQAFPNNIFPYSEPSHFAAFLVPVLALGFFLSGAFGKIIFGTALLSAAMFYPSLTMAVQGCLLLAIFVGSHIRRSFVLPLSIAALLIPIFPIFLDSLGQLDFFYFTDRLNFNETQNISSLVYLQGWNRALLSLQQTTGFGVGFQNLENLSIGMYGYDLIEILGVNKNLRDGGFIAAKLVGEFGLLGVGFIILYVLVFLKTIFEVIDYAAKLPKLTLAKTPTREEQIEYQRFIANILITFFIVELLIRGTSYFSLGVFLFWTGYSLRRSTGR